MGSSTVKSFIKERFPIGYEVEPGSFVLGYADDHQDEEGDLPTHLVTVRDGKKALHVHHIPLDYDKSPGEIPLSEREVISYPRSWGTSESFDLSCFLIQHQHP